MLYETATAARASETLALDIEDLDLGGRRARVVSKGGKTEWVYWSTGTAHLLPRLVRGRTLARDSDFGPSPSGSSLSL